MQSVSPTDERLITAFKSAKRVFVSTGAGVSRESGLATFRDDDGIWQRFDPMLIATPEGFASDPVKVWNFYRLLQKEVEAAKPNPAHEVIAQMEDFYPEFLLTTQNVDDLHERAGNRKMVKIHGDIWETRCLGCGDIFDGRALDLPDEFDSYNLPTCPLCTDMCRPNIVWFGEYVPEEPMMSSVKAASDCDLCLVVGTSGEVSGGYGFVQYALRNGAKVVEVNPREGALTRYAHYWIAEKAGEALPELWNAVVSE